MINVGKYVVKADNIPADWIFSHYLKLGKLKGQSVKMKSIFNEKDSVPSLIIYYNRKLNKPLKIFHQVIQALLLNL
jgi:hypothetical protein